MLLLEVIVKLGLMCPVMEMSVSGLELIHPERLRVTDFESMTCFTLLCRREAAIVISCYVTYLNIQSDMSLAECSSIHHNVDNF